jgi:putative methionine-R-sulfoxide reductase with GAF domain
LDISQKTSAYSAALTTLRSELAKTNDEAFIYKLVVDTLSKFPYFSWIGVYFFNPVTKEFYLGYYIGKQTKASVIKLNQLRFTKFEIINDIKAENKLSICPEVSSECKLLLIKNETILGLIAMGSKNSNIFDEIDRKYLLEIAETAADKVYHH